MLTVDEALELVLKHARPLPPAELELMECLACRLAEDITADADHPPFDRSMVDGYALRAADLALAAGRLKIGETILAGQTPSRAIAPGEAAAIMTGAPLPPGADAALMLEQTRWLDSEIAVESRDVRTGQNILRQGCVYREGDVLLQAGVRLSATHVGLLASVGKPRVHVIPRPRLAILPTGDELVDPDQIPGPGQIRNSNAAMLEALTIEHGALPRVLPIAADDLELLYQRVQESLNSDMLLLTGGVSAGQHDLVPAALERCGIRPVFHKVRIKPGKPVWFGIGPERGEHPRTLVFGLPGNPASTLVDFLVFVAPAIRALRGHSETVPAMLRVQLAFELFSRGDRINYWPARWVQRPSTDVPGVPGVVDTLDWAGSADLVGMARADGFVVLDAGNRLFRAGEIVRFLPLR